MKLSQAIILGDTLKKCDPLEWISEDGLCGCAFGGALLAAGVEPAKFRAENNIYLAQDTPIVNKLWPWIDRTHLERISNMYHEVAKGIISLEAIAEYVKEIEPEEVDESTGSNSVAVGSGVGDLCGVAVSACRHEDRNEAMTCIFYRANKTDQVGKCHGPNHFELSQVSA